MLFSILTSLGASARYRSLPLCPIYLFAAVLPSMFQMSRLYSTCVDRVAMPFQGQAQFPASFRQSFLPTEW